MRMAGGGAQVNEQEWRAEERGREVVGEAGNEELLELDRDDEDCMRCTSQCVCER